MRTPSEVKKLIIKELPELKARDIMVRIQKRYTTYNIILKKVVPLSKVRKAVEELENWSQGLNQYGKQGSVLGRIIVGKGMWEVVVGFEQRFDWKAPGWPVEISENIREAIKNVAKSIMDDKSMCVIGKTNYIGKMLLDSELFAKDYTEQDVVDVVEAAYFIDKEIEKMIGELNFKKI